MERRPGNSEEAEGRNEGEHAMPDFGSLRVERGAPRPATILKVADELESRGGEILELFKEVTSPAGQAVFPIHMRQSGREFFIEVETGPWESQVVESLLTRASVLRSSGKSGAELRIVSAYSAPEDVEFLTSRAPAALLQLDLIWGSLDQPEEFAETFRVSAGRSWETELGYSTEYLPLTEELLIAAFDAYENGGRPPILNELIEGLGCFLGEIIRRGSPSRGEWRESEEWGEGVVLEVGDLSLDPIGKARAFMFEGAGDSVAFYAEFALEEIRRSVGEAPG